jgi:hypothetical protein
MIRADEPWHVMASDLDDSLRMQNLIDFKFTIEPIGAIEEFDGTVPIRYLNEAVLADSRTQRSEQTALMPGLVFANSKSSHAIFP